jgi:cytochrome d ubiquinol oxidase subunit I
VYGQLRTADAVSPISTQAVATSLVTFFVVYLFVFGFGSYYLAKLLRRGPDPVESDLGGGSGTDSDLSKKAKRPLSVPNEGMQGSPGHRPAPAE